ncbi:TraR/DksA family transcriptional regulator [Massilia sp. DWR3-1-1]|uniref:TraR/DksA family transcriptional regulator n=1 Tax=Massilia sp. DWR3-1-1 TaxID=2804559 RepID=UPI003CEA5E5C
MRKLTSSDLDEIEDKLRTLRLSALLALRARLADGAGQDGQGGRPHRGGGGQPDGADEGDVDAMFTATQIATLGSAVDELRAIDAALRRIEFGVGGLCVDCGAPIGIERLRVAPAAATCLSCAGQAA